MATIASIPKGVRIRDDPLPKIQTAGKIIATGGSNSDHSIRPELYGFSNPGNPGTPDNMRKYRRTTNNSPGQIIVHPGLQSGKPEIPKGHIYGKKTQFSDTVKETVKA